MKYFKNILFFLSVSLLLLHSVIPHIHEGEETANFEILKLDPNHNHSLLGILKLVFFENPGQNHLEDFQSESSMDIDFYTLESSFCFRSPHGNEVYFVNHTLVVFQAYTPTPSRAPPAQGSYFTPAS